MVFLDFLFDNSREDKWIEIIENNATINKLNHINNIGLMVAIGIGLIITYLTKKYDISLAYFSGILLYSFIASLDEFLSTDGVRNGMMGLLYLEVLDASFSFDGVIGAFALSKNIFIIMIGLGIGQFCKNLTIYLVEKKTLSELKYLDTRSQLCNSCFIFHYVL